MTQPKIGFIGLGLMGAAMVGRLQDKGYSVTALANRNRTGIDAAIARGASEAANGREVAQASDIIMLCMGTSDQVESRMRGADGVIAGLSAGKIVVDFGTATTFDVVDFEGAYAGGLIVPGVNLSLKALHEAAAKLPNVDVARPQQVVGIDTESCMQSGVYWGYISLIEGVCKRISDELETEMKVIATGGLSVLMATGTTAIHHVDNDVTMRGLVKIFKENKGAA